MLKAACHMVLCKLTYHCGKKMSVQRQINVKIHISYICNISNAQTSKTEIAILRNRKSCESCEKCRYISLCFSFHANLTHPHPPLYPPSYAPHYILLFLQRLREGNQTKSQTKSTSQIISFIPRSEGLMFIREP